MKGFCNWRVNGFWTGSKTGRGEWVVKGFCNWRVNGFWTGSKTGRGMGSDIERWAVKDMRGDGETHGMTCIFTFFCAT